MSDDAAKITTTTPSNTPQQETQEKLIQAIKDENIAKIACLNFVMSFIPVCCIAMCNKFFDMNCCCASCCCDGISGTLAVVAYSLFQEQLQPFVGSSLASCAGFFFVLPIAQAILGFLTVCCLGQYCGLKLSKGRSLKQTDEDLDNALDSSAVLGADQYACRVCCLKYGLYKYVMVPEATKKINL